MPCGCSIGKTYVELHPYGSGHGWVLARFIDVVPAGSKGYHALRGVREPQELSTLGT